MKAKMKALYVLFCAILSLYISFSVCPYIGENSDIVGIVTTVITVFAGFLVAILTIIGDASSIPNGNWRIAENRRDSFEYRIIAHQWLFFIYMLSIAFLFAGYVVQKADKSVISMETREIIKYLYLFFSIFSFFLTISLPYSLGKMQLDRIDREIENRRNSTEIENE